MPRKPANTVNPYRKDYKGAVATRSIRVPNVLWRAALKATKANDTNVSAVVNEFLAEYVAITIRAEKLADYEKNSREVYDKLTNKIVRKHLHKKRKVRKPNVLLYTPRPDRTRVAIPDELTPPDKCSHIRTTDTAFGEWCMDCATLTHPIGTSGVFMQYLTGTLEPDYDSDESGLDKLKPVRKKAKGEPE